jgi:chemotaxis signal transduction protein
MDLLIPARELREVVASTPVAPLPGRPRGIQGVVIYQGEFLPVLAWEDLPGCKGRAQAPVALAVLRRRLGLPLERMIATVAIPEGGGAPLPEGHPAEGWMNGSVQIGDEALPLLDPDQLIALLRQFRGAR